MLATLTLWVKFIKIIVNEISLMICVTIQKDSKGLSWSVMRMWPVCAVVALNGSKVGGVKLWRFITILKFLI